MKFTPKVLESCAEQLRARFPQLPIALAVVSGSGINLALPGGDKLAELSYQEVFPFPVHPLLGHRPTLSLWRVHGQGVVLFHGRFHLYQGYSAAEVAAIPRLAALWGASTYILTNAAGSLHPQIAPGSLVVLSDHLNLQGANPLVGEWGRWREPVFPDMSFAYDPQLRQLALSLARETGFAAWEGVYAGVLGPSYETPAEVRMLGQLGGTVVGMSTVQEVIAARHMGLRVLGLSLVTNYAAGIAAQPLTHQEVLEAGALAQAKLIRLITTLVERLVQP
ncbi:MAG: purine-nucleoside phosphorylase [Thermoanaerobaculum sp.]|nr:purine-nucleoside phosphorylase [Thermoanaerobaculum sp.]